MPDQPFRVVFPLYPDVTQLDFSGPHTVFSRVPGAKVLLASAAGGEIESDGIVFGRLPKLEDVPTCDLICVPGGFGATDVFTDEVYMRELKRLATGARYITSVCTGSLILAGAGLLKGRRAACHWAWRDLLGRFDGVTVDSARVVRDGNVFTGGGVTAGIDLALTVAAQVFGPEIAQSIQLGIEYAPAPPFESGRPELATPQVRAIVDARNETQLAVRRAAVEAQVRRMS
jgi:transcriptional regulator GlxA family with amidase domain